MGLGLSKSFIIFLALSIIASIGMKSWKVGAGIMICYSIVKIIWGILTN